MDANLTIGKALVTDNVFMNFRREKGVIGEIRNQLSCGACWAFSTVQNVESMVAMKTGRLPTLSVQEVSVPFRSFLTILEVSDNLTSAG